MIFDIANFFIIVGTTLRGAWIGGVAWLLRCVFFLATVFISIFLFPILKSLGNNYMQNAVLLDGVSGVLSYIISMFIITIFSRSINYPRIGFISRFCGAGLGLLEGVFFCNIIFIISFIISTESYYKTSTILEIFENIQICPYPNWVVNSLFCKFYLLFQEFLGNLIDKQWFYLQISKIKF